MGESVCSSSNSIACGRIRWAMPRVTKKFKVKVIDVAKNARTGPIDYLKSSAMLIEIADAGNSQVVNNMPMSCLAKPHTTSFEE